LFLRPRLSATAGWWELGARTVHLNMREMGDSRPILASDSHDTPQVTPADVTAVTRVEQVGQVAIVHGAKASLSITETIDVLGYQVGVLVCVGGLVLANACTQGIVSPLNDALDAEMHLTTTMKATLPTLLYLGTAIGVLCSGPVGDRIGRVGPIYASYLGLIVTSLWLVLLDSEKQLALACCRFLMGFACGFGQPVSFALVSETMPSAARAAALYAMATCGIMGYMLASFGMRLFLPDLGVTAGLWRHLIGFTALPSVVCLLLSLVLLEESPSFLAVSGDSVGVQRVMDKIAAANVSGYQSSSHSTHRWAAFSARVDRDAGHGMLSTVAAVSVLMDQYFWRAMTICTVDVFRGFMVSGSAYTFPKLLAQVEDSRFAPATLDLISQMTAIAGIVVGVARKELQSIRMFMRMPMPTRTVRLEAVVGLMLARSRVPHRAVLGAAAVVAAVSLMSLVVLNRSSAALVLWCCIAVRFTYNPMQAALSTIAVETFPTAFRATAMGGCHLIAKLGVVAAPAILEVAWAVSPTRALVVLATAAACAAVCSWALPATNSQLPLKDFVDPHRKQGPAERAAEKLLPRKLLAGRHRFEDRARYGTLLRLAV